MIISHEQLLALNEMNGFGPKKIHFIAEILHGEGNGFCTDHDIYDVIQGLVRRNVLRSIKHFNFPDYLSAIDKAKRILDLSASKSISMVSRYDDNYPEAFLHTVNELGKEAIPPFLFFKGNLNAANNKSIAIIGSSSPSKEGEPVGYFFSNNLAQKGINIVSGLALGCDTAAHKGAIAAKGMTTAILGNGLDKIYPRENIDLAEDIVRNGGLLLSEYPIGKYATPYTLVARDRLQAALSQIILVVQTSVAGGTMHTVNAASIARKQIFVVDYKKDLSEIFISGNIALIQKQIARPVGCSMEDVMTLYNTIQTGNVVSQSEKQLSLFGN